MYPDVRSALIDLIPGYTPTEADVNYWSNHGGVDAVMSTFKPTAAPAPTPVAQTPAPATQQANLGQLQQDLNAFWSTAKPGDVVPFAGGTLEVNNNGSATWGDGRTPYGLNFNKDTPIDVIAGRSAQIADKWYNDYGYKTPDMQPMGASFGQGMSDTVTTAQSNADATARQREIDAKKQREALEALIAQIKAQNTKPAASTQTPTQKPSGGLFTPSNVPASGLGYGVTAQGPASGMTNQQSWGDYNEQMQRYYNAYFGGAQPDLGINPGWYQSTYTPPVTGYQKPTQPTAEQPPNPLQGQSGGSGGNFNFGGTTSTGSGSSNAPGGQGVNQTTANAALAMLAASKNPAIRALSPVAAALLGLGGGAIADGQINGMSAADAKLAASQALAGMGINTISDSEGNIRTISTPGSITAADQGMFGSSTGAGGRSPGFGSLGNSSFGEGQY